MCVFDLTRLLSWQYASHGNFSHVLASSASKLPAVCVVWQERRTDRVARFPLKECSRDLETTILHLNSDRYLWLGVLARVAIIG
jgi:hypothetical protein